MPELVEKTSGRNLFHKSAFGRRRALHKYGEWRTVASAQNTPLSTARVSCQGRPRLSARRASRSTGSTIAHRSLVSSQLPAIGACGDTELLQNATKTLPQVFMGLVLEFKKATSNGNSNSMSSITSSKFVHNVP